ncbi:MAG TPA: hypothetical protein VK149_04320 [Sideroxyarcus sp.]|nr:hypothetical protein [Sideroxyarcus sp.]
MVIDFTILGSNGDVIPLDGSEGYNVTTGLRGLGVPSTDVRIDNSAGDGGTWRSTRRGLREIDLPLVILGADRDETEEKLRRLAKALSDRYGTPYLRADYADGSAYTIEVHYTGGAETVFGADANETFVRWPITLSCPDPFWTSVQSVQFSLGYQSGNRGLLPRLDQLQVAPSGILGAYQVENTGDVEAYPVWTLTGTATNVSITLNGVGFTYTETMTSSSRVTINTRLATVADASNNNKYAFLGAAPKLFALPPGTSTINITVSGADTSTVISGYFNPRREVLH